MASACCQCLLWYSRVAINRENPQICLGGLDFPAGSLIIDHIVIVSAGQKMIQWRLVWWHGCGALSSLTTVQQECFRLWQQTGW